MSSLCGCCRRDKLSSFCFNLFNGELSFSYSFKLYRLCNSSFKLDWHYEKTEGLMTAECVFCTQCNISLGEMLHPCVQAGTAQCSPALGQTPGHCLFPGHPQCPQRKNQPPGAWLRDPGLKIQPHFPPGQWAGVFLGLQSGQAGFALKRCHYSTGRFFEVQREPESLSTIFNSLLVWLERQR